MRETTVAKRTKQESIQMNQLVTETEPTYGVIETPDNAGLVDPRNAAIVGETGGKTLNERAQASTP